MKVTLNFTIDTWLKILIGCQTVKRSMSRFILTMKLAIAILPVELTLPQRALFKPQVLKILLFLGGLRNSR